MTVPSGTGAQESTQQQVLAQLQVGTGGGPVTIADGANVAQGTTTDTAGANTLVGQTKQVVTNTTGLATQTTLAAAKTDLDTIVTQTATPNVSDRWARQVGQVDLARVNGASLSQSNPVIIEDSIRNWIRNGNGFTYFNPSGSVTAGSALTICGLSIFNPANSGKNILIYRISVASNSGSSIGIQLRLTTSDPSNGTGYTGTATALNLKAGGGNTVASLCASATSIAASPTLPGVAWGTYGLTGNAPNEVLSPGSTLLLPSGSTAYGLAVMIFVNTSGNAFTCTVNGIEY